MSHLLSRTSMAAVAVAAVAVAAVAVAAVAAAAAARTLNIQFPTQTPLIETVADQT